ncbi:MAG TPA: L-aspartate oxidase [Mycobacteriales bacterium]|nr:L-aspartate oxidase [Mycobacteriales bacterium]
MPDPGPLPARLGPLPAARLGPLPARLAVPTPTWQRCVDVVVVGSGAAGLSCALTVAAAGRSVLMMTKGDLGDGATRWAQGGLAAVNDPTDRVPDHVEDTLRAGAGLCDDAAVRALVAAAPTAVASLRRLGARFDTTREGRLALSREGGHRTARVVRAGGDASGAELLRVLLAGLNGSAVQVLPHAVACDARLDADGRVAGVTVACAAPDGAIQSTGEVSCRVLVLATGGIGQAYAATTNPAGATGDGLALALRAGAVVRDIEFVQFHPTALWLGPDSGGQQILVTEAIRGEGAVLVDATGRRVMLGVHPAADLAPRDVVVTAMARRMAEEPGLVDDHLWLDATMLGAGTLERRFPTVVAACRARGVDPVTEPIPVAPAAHYACGGVETGLDGASTVPGLYVVGEAACTGMHGANRLASNSLVEAVVTGRWAGRRLARSLPSATLAAPPPAAARCVAATTRSETATHMSRAAGVLRDPIGLERLLDHLRAVPMSDAPARHIATIEATNAHTVSTLVAVAAAARLESRGCHRRVDVTEPQPGWRAHVRLRLRHGALRVDRAPVRAAA